MSNPNDPEMRKIIQEEITLRETRETEAIQRLADASTRYALSTENYTRNLEAIHETLKRHTELCAACPERQQETAVVLKEICDLLKDRQSWVEKVVVPIITSLLTGGVLLFVLDHLLKLKK